MGISRRKFIKGGISMFGGLGVSSIVESRFALAQSSNSGGKNLVIVNLYGGLDGMAAFPYYDGSLVSLINNTLRPTIRIPAGNIIPFGAQSGVGQKIGFHPALSSLVTHAGSNIKIIKNYGILGDPGRSHDTCQVLMSLGASGSTGDVPAMQGFLARYMDQQNWESMQFWALRNDNPSDTHTMKKQPVKVYDLSELEVPRLWGEGIKLGEYNWNLSQSLIDIQNPGDQIDTLQINTLNSVHRTLAIVQSEISSQTVGNNIAGKYDEEEHFGRTLRDAAKVLKAKRNSSTLGLSQKNMILLTGQSGYDTHADQNNLNVSGNLNELLTTLGNNLAVFYRDLADFGILQDTVIVLYSEFGRTTHENGSQGSPGVGTDHGHGNHTVVLGGPVKAGVIGADPTSTELTDEYDAMVPKIDYRDVFSDLFEWLGSNPTEIFNTKDYVRTKLGLIG
jgi:uncharacterized protein (DUF1501 family)